VEARNFTSVTSEIENYVFFHMPALTPRITFCAKGALLFWSSTHSALVTKSKLYSFVYIHTFSWSTSANFTFLSTFVNLIVTLT